MAAHRATKSGFAAEAQRKVRIRCRNIDTESVIGDRDDLIPQKPT